MNASKTTSLPDSPSFTVICPAIIDPFAIFYHAFAYLAQYFAPTSSDLHHRRDDTSIWRTGILDRNSSLFYHSNSQIFGRNSY